MPGKEKPGATAREAYAQACLELKNAGFSEEAACYDAKELLAFCCGKEGLRLLLALDEEITQAEAGHYREAVKRLAGREPMAYITGSQDFGGLDIRVAPGVLVPRRDTLVLVQQALSKLAEDEAAYVLELGCGSGAVIASLAAARPLLRGLAVDADPMAIRVTGENLERYGLSGRIRLRQGSWFTEVGSHERFDLIVSNPPYISSDEMRCLDESVKKEPEKALWGGQDGLDAYRHILPAAYKALRRQGWCIVEIGWKQGAAVEAMFTSAGFSDVELFRDEGGRDRVVAGCRREGAAGRIKTAYWRAAGPEDPKIKEAGRMIREGRLVAFPTETVYGLGANGLDAEAVAGIFEAKGRPADNPLILHVASIADAKALAGTWSEKARRATEEFWPGPLTVVLSAAGHIPKAVTAGLDTVAIRYPSSRVALALIEAAGVPVAAPSANTSGRPSPTRAEHVLEDMDGLIDVIIDGGPCEVGFESTIIDLSVEPPAILRPGGTTREALSRILGEIRAEEKQGAGGAECRDKERVPKAPGMKYRHYAPKARVTVLQGGPYAVAAFVAGLLRGADRAPGWKAGLLLCEETWRVMPLWAREASSEKGRFFCRDMGGRNRPGEMGRILYDAFRACDKENAAEIFVEACTAEGQGEAVLNRLRKAAGDNIKQV